MESENIKQLTINFESYVNLMDNWIDFWFARDLQTLLWYSKWSNFSNVIEKAKLSLKSSWYVITEHFAGVGKTIGMPNKAKKEIEDIMLTRYACYIIAMNGNSIKEEIAFAQQYFAIQTRNFEIIEKRILESERLRARKKLVETEK